MEINDEVYTSLFIENFNKITTRSMFYGSVIKQQNQSIIFNTKICSFSIKYLYMYSYSQNVSMNVLRIPKTPILG
jgi:hypothetical protein